MHTWQENNCPNCYQLHIQTLKLSREVQTLKDRLKAAQQHKASDFYQNLVDRARENAILLLQSYLTVPLSRREVMDQNLMTQTQFEHARALLIAARLIDRRNKKMPKVTYQARSEDALDLLDAAAEKCKNDKDFFNRCRPRKKK